jgi:dual specificity protein kinase YAK1
LDRIPASSYLSKRIQTQHDSLSESRKVAIARPLSANSALAFISDQGHTGKLKDPPKSLKRGETSTAKIDAIPSSPRRNVCLTHPGEPVHNHGYDNVDGNLIVHEHDVIKPQSYCNMVIKGQELVKRLEARDSPSFRVLNLLGQGTFAHVFKCENVRTKDHVAVKIIKNKPAYTNQALIEIDIFLRLNRSSVDATNSTMRGKSKRTQDPFVNLLCYFMYRSHLCLVFELLGMNLYEILKRRQFRGLPLSVVRDFMRQALDGMNIMASQNIIHCDLKPENILIVTENTLNDIHMMEEAPRISNLSPKIKLIDFGSACFEGQLGHAYIQSRFYRSPEVLLGLDYDSAIDVWSLGCVAAELLLGLPILPGLNEHDQLTRICEMIGEIPEWMIENG